MEMDPCAALDHHPGGCDRLALYRSLAVRPASTTDLAAVAGQPQDLLTQNRRQAVFSMLKYMSSEWAIEPVVGRNPGYPSVAGTA